MDPLNMYICQTSLNQFPGYGTLKLGVVPRQETKYPTCKWGHLHNRNHIQLICNLNLDTKKLI